MPIISKSCAQDWVKFLYISCSTLSLCALIVGAILIHLVVIPFTHENSFHSSTCTLINTNITTSIKCENKCSKDRSMFPCLQITARYTDLDQEFMAYVYDHIATLSHYRKSQCAISPCFSSTKDNGIIVSEFQSRMRKTPTFACYINTEHRDEVLLYKFYSIGMFWHCVAWPSGLLVISLLILAVLYSKDKCNAWNDA